MAEMIVMFTKCLLLHEIVLQNMPLDRRAFASFDKDQWPYLG